MTFIVFEGLDGSGKTTQIDLLSNYLRAEGYAYELVAEPGTTAVGLGIRDILLHRSNAVSPRAELMLYEAARAQLTDERILPALEQGKIVVADRYSLSSIVYQGYGRQLDQRRVHALDRWATRGLRPNLTLLLDMPVAERHERQGKAYAPDRLEQENGAFFERVRQGYLRELRRTPGGYRLDGTQPAPAVFERIKGLVEQLLDGD